MVYPNLYQNYQPYYPPNVNVNNNSSIIWVQGEAGAKSYSVAPNTTVPLWDSEQKTIYLKSADASGMPSIKYIDYTIRENGQKMNEIVPNNNYATVDDIDCIYHELDELKRKLEDMTNRRYTSKKKEVEHNGQSRSNAKSD